MTDPTPSDIAARVYNNPTLYPIVDEGRVDYPWMRQILFEYHVEQTGNFKP